MVNFTAKCIRKKIMGQGLRFVSVVAALLLVLGSCALGEGQTSLVVTLKGVSTADGNNWSSISLSGRFQVKGPDGTVLGQVRANPSPEQVAAGENDTLVVEGLSQVVLVPFEEDFQAGFVFAGPVEITLESGASTKAALVAYARQGFFAVKDTLADSGAAVPGGQYEVLDQDGNTRLSFTTDAEGRYVAAQCLPAGAYTLRQLQPGEGALPMGEGVAFEVKPYTGNASDIARVPVQSQTVPSLEDMPQIAVAKAQPFASEGQLDSDALLSTLEITAGSNGENTFALKDYAITLMPVALGDTTGAQAQLSGAVVLESCLAQVETQGIQVLLQGLDSKGQPLSEAQLLSSGQLAVLDSAAGLKITYIDAATGEAVVPAGFKAGNVTFSLILLPTASPENAINQVLFEGQVSYTLEYPDGDGVKALVAQGEKTAFSIPVEGVSFTEVSKGLLEGVIAQDGVPVSGMTVQLTDEQGNRASQVSGADGSYAFTGLEAGTYQIALSLEPGMMAQGSRPEGDLVLEMGQRARQDFAVERAASLAGRLNACPEGQQVTAVSIEQTFTVQTQADGSFRLEGLPKGDYTVYAPMLEAKSLPEDSPWQLTQGGDMIWISVSLQSGQEAALPEVTYVEMTSIHGVAYIDANGDMQYQNGEQLMTGVSVMLQRQENGQWTDIAQGQTNEYGEYSFVSLPQGAYRVSSRLSAEGLYVAAVGPTAEALGGDGTMVSPEIQLSYGDRSRGQADVALSKPTSLQFAAFFDSNEDGLKGQHERSIARVLVEVMEADGQTVMAQGLTGSNGEVTVENIRPGQHMLRVTLPTGYAFTCKGEGQGLGVSCVAAEGASALSEPIAFMAGTVTQAGAGAIPVGSFSGRVWDDVNNNGIMDPDEPGVAGVQVKLEGIKTKTSQTFTTDESGEYHFYNLYNDTYRLTAQLPEGMLFARYSPTGGDMRSVFTGEGTKMSREFPLTGYADIVNKNIGVIEKGVVDGYAFLDNNYNGIYDQGEPGYPGVTLEIIKASNSKSMGKTVTDQNGYFRFENLRGGEYRLRAILPDDGSIFTMVPQTREGQVNLFAQRESRRENTIAPITIGNGGYTSTVVGVARGAKIKGTVFLDADYDGIMKDKEKKSSGIKVELLDALGTVVANTTTNANGNYTLDGIMPGTYTLRFLRKDNYAFTRLRSGQNGGSWVKGLQGDYGVTEPMVITMGQDITGVNAGMLPSSTLTGIFFDDLNDNGLRDEGENGMTDVRVRLYSEDAEIDLTVPVQDDGSYFFDGVMPGKYALTFYLPEHVEMAKTAKEGNTLGGEGREIVTTQFTIDMGTASQYPMVGAVRLGSFEGYLFHDINGNSIADEGEERMAGMKVTFTSDIPSEAIATTDASGYFILTDLRPAQYQLTLQLPEGYIFSGNLEASGIKLDTLNKQTLSCPWAALVGRAENAIGAVKPATLRGYVWLDENRDGSQGPEETLLSGLTYELIDETKGSIVKTATSGEDGYVTFENVRPGTYAVRFTIPQQAEPAGEADATFTVQSGKMVQKGIVVREGETFDNIHAGLVSRTSIGGTLVLEENGTRMPLEEVQVKLYQQGQTEPVNTVLTGADGTYRFNGLWPADYYVEAALPTGMIFVEPGDPNYPAGSSIITATQGSVGTSAPFSLQMAKHRLQENIIYIRPAKVGDIAWLDTNKNGLVDVGEPVIPGVKVTLLRAGQPVMETVTDSYGYYIFPNVYPGAYTLQAEAYPELGITTSVPVLRIISSCLTSGDGSLAQSDPFTVVSGSTNFDFDFGYILLDGQQWPSAIVAPPDKNWTGGYISGGN